jgi:hypothetical protein
MTSPAGTWLTTSESSLNVSAGANNTATFDVQLNLDGNINSPGTIVALDGEVYLLTNAPAPRDSVSFMINDFLIADTVVGLVFDTLSTGVIRIAVSNQGSMGQGGIGGVNLDYTGLGLDCDDNATTYMHTGGPMLIQADGGDTAISYGMHAGVLTRVMSWYPVTDYAAPADVSTGDYEAFFTGTFVNWDSTIACEKTVYAPTGGGDYTDFIIQSFRLFPLDAGTHSNLAIGEMVDWDIPSDDGFSNYAYVSTAGNTVYFQGIDDPAEDPPGCQDNANRFAAQGFLGMYSNSEYNSNSCANDDAFYGAYGGRNDSDVFIDDTLQAAYLWEKTLNNSGLNGNTEETDIHGVMTFVHGAELAPGDTLTFYSVFTTVMDGDLAELEGNLTSACAWYQEYLRPTCSVCGCCVGLTGNVDNDPGDGVDLGDLTALIDFLFISFTPPVCMEEANVDGDPGGGVDLGDLTALIDFLFISFTPPAPCQ